MRLSWLIFSILPIRKGKSFLQESDSVILAKIIRQRL